MPYRFDNGAGINEDNGVPYNGGNGFLLSLIVGADGFVYASNTNAIFKVVVTP